MTTDKKCPEFSKNMNLHLAFAAGKQMILKGSRIILTADFASLTLATRKLDKNHCYLDYTRSS